MRNFSYILSLVILLVNCRKDVGVGPQCVECPSDTLDLNVITKLFVINEGNYGGGNASISLYDIESATVQNQIYKSANNANLLGDVAMSLEIINDKGYVTINNSDKVVIIDLSTFKKIGEITGVNSPRFIKQVNENKAYITSLYADKIYVIDLTLNSVADTIQTGGWNEELVVFNEKAFVVNKDLNILQIIDVSTNTIIQTVSLGKSPNSVVLDANSNLWILCDGGFDEENAKLIKVSTSDFTILTTFQFADIQDYPEHLKINDAGDVLYFINQGVAKMSIDAVNLPSSVLILKNDRTLYGLGIDPQTEDIYISDAKDYVQEGQIYRYTLEGTEIDSFKVGLIPRTFTFYAE